MATFEYLYSDGLNLTLNSSDSNTLFTTARRKQAINEAQAQFCDLTECLLRQSSITVSCNTAEYNLLSSAVLGGSTDFARLSTQSLEYRVRSSGATPRWITWLTGDDFLDQSVTWRNRQTPGWRQSTTVGTPTGYYIRPNGGQLLLGLDVAPNVGSSEAAEILVPYLARPAAMTSSGDVPFTVGGATRTDLTLFHDALPHYAAYTLLGLTGDENGAQAQLQKFMGYVTRYFGQQAPRGPKQVSLNRNYLGRARRRAGSPVPASQWD